ncbi:MAG: M1 family metallopeptidase [Clostridia bacterium]|nr:M1 family metallopeptidase [Clostridia bacterium]
MKKRFVRFVALSVSFLFVFSFVFLSVGCGFDDAVNKASKNLTSYNLNLNLDENSHTISGSEDVQFINMKDEKLSDLCFHLYPRAFRDGAKVLPYTTLTEARCFPNGKSEGNIVITKVLVDNKNATFSYDGEDENILKVNLVSPLEYKDKINVLIDFVITIPNCTHRFGYYDNNINLGNFYPILCVRENGEWNKTPYYATGDPFFSECANFHVTISAPNTYEVVASGNFINSTQEGLNKKTSFEGKTIRDFAIVLSKDIKEVSSKEGNTVISYYGRNEDVDLNENLQTAVKAFRFLRGNFGEYPYRTLKVVKTPFMQGGMEYPNLVMVSSLLTDKDEINKVIVHELAHQWWYGLVGNNEINNAFIDEGLSEYSTFLFFDKHREYGFSMEDLILDAEDGYNLYMEVFSSIGISVNTKMDVPVNMYQSEYEYTYMVYVRGALMYHYLAKELGEKEMINALKTLNKKYRFKIITKEDLISCFRNKAKAKIIIDSFLNGTCYLDKT